MPNNSNDKANAPSSSSRSFPWLLRGNRNSNSNSNSNNSNSSNSSRDMTKPDVANRHLTRALLGCKTNPKVLDLIRRFHRSGFTPNGINLAVACHALALLFRPHDVITRSAEQMLLLIQLLTQCVTDNAPVGEGGLSADHLAKIYQGLATARVINRRLLKGQHLSLLQPTSRFLAALAQTTAQRAGRISPFYVVKVLRAHAQCGIQPPPALYLALQREVQRKAHGMTARMISDSLWSLAHFRQRSSEAALVQLLESAADNASDLTARNVAMVLWATAKLGHLKEVRQRVDEDGVTASTPSPLQLLVRRFYHAVSARGVQVVDSFTPREVSNTLWALAESYVDPKQRFFAKLLRMTEGFSTVCHFPLGDCVVSIWSLARLLLKPDPIRFDALSRQLVACQRAAEAARDFWRQNAMRDEQKVEFRPSAGESPASKNDSRAEAPPPDESPLESPRTNDSPKKIGCRQKMPKRLPLIGPAELVMTLWALQATKLSPNPELVAILWTQVAQQVLKLTEVELGRSFLYLLRLSKFPEVGLPNPDDFQTILEDVSARCRWFIPRLTLETFFETLCSVIDLRLDPAPLPPVSTPTDELASALGSEVSSTPPDAQPIDEASPAGTTDDDVLPTHDNAPQLVASDLSNASAVSPDDDETAHSTTSLAAAALPCATTTGRAASPADATATATTSTVASTCTPSADASLLPSSTSETAKPATGPSTHFVVSAPPPAKASEQEGEGSTQDARGAGVPTPPPAPPFLPAALLPLIKQLAVQLHVILRDPASSAQLFARDVERVLWVLAKSAERDRADAERGVSGEGAKQRLEIPPPSVALVDSLVQLVEEKGSKMALNETISVVWSLWRLKQVSEDVETLPPAPASSPSPSDSSSSPATAAPAPSPSSSDPLIPIWARPPPQPLLKKYPNVIEVVHARLIQTQPQIELRGVWLLCSAYGQSGVHLNPDLAELLCKCLLVYFQSDRTAIARPSSCQSDTDVVIQTMHYLGMVRAQPSAALLDIFTQQLMADCPRETAQIARALVALSRFDAVAVATTTTTTPKSSFVTETALNALRPPLSIALGNAILEEFDYASSDDLHFAVSALAKAKPTPTDILLELSTKIAGRRQALNAHCLEMTLWAIAKSQVVDSGVLLALSRQAVKDTALLEPGHIANMLWALARSQMAPPEPVEALCKELVLRVGDFPPRYLSTAMWALARLRVNDKGLIAALSAQALKTVNRFDGQDVCNTLWALASLGGPVESELAEVMLVRLTQVVHFLGPHQIALTLWAIARGQLSVEPKLNRALTKTIIAQAPSFDAADMSITLWALARCGATMDDDLVQALCENAQWRSFKPNETVAVLMALHWSGRTALAAELDSVLVHAHQSDIHVHLMEQHRLVK